MVKGTIMIYKIDILSQSLERIIHEAIEKFISVYENLSSDNPEDYANAVHSCRRILIDLADALYPPCDIPLEINGKIIKTLLRL